MKHPYELFEIVHAQTGLSEQDLKKRARYKNLVYARIEFFKLARAEGYSYSAIARHLRRDHTTIMYYARRLKNEQDKGI